MKNNENMRDKELHGIESNKILIPETVILDTTMNKYRVAVLIYLFCKTGMDYQVSFSVGKIVEWLGRTSVRPINKDYNNAASGIKDCLEKFKKENYFSYYEELKYANLVNGVFDKEKYSATFNRIRFAKIYVDELQKILNYENKDTKIDKTILFLVFAFLRARIPVKNNLSGAGERADAYDNHYKSIGNEIGLSERLVSKMVDVLVDLGLIYKMHRGLEVYYYDENGNTMKKFKEKTIIFCNTYKRIDKNGKTYLVAEGKDYYLKEANDKENELNQKGM